MNGANNSTTFVDSSSKARTVTANGDAKQTTTAPIRGSACGTFDGTGDYLVAGAAADWKFLHDATTDWTFECWAQANNFAAERALIDTCAGSTANVGIYISVDVSRGINIQIMRGVGGSRVLNVNAGFAFPNDTNFHHIRVTYSPGAASEHSKLFVDGVLTAVNNKLGNAPSAANPTAALQIGRFSGSGTGWVGKLDDLRISSSIFSTTSFALPAEFPDA